MLTTLDKVAIQQYPWTKVLYQSLLSNQQNSVLPHALLLTGIDGLGKLAMSQLLAKSLLCQQTHPTGDDKTPLPCGECHDCNLFKANHHPDYLLIEPEKKGGNILIDQIRQLTAFVSLKSHLGGMQLIVINQAHCLNRNAANSLLKTLEEPTQNVLLLLISSNPNRLPATVKSRCQLRVMETPKLESALQWLQATDSATTQPEQMLTALRLSYGAPLLAQSYLADGVIEQYHTQFSQFLALSTRPISVVEVAAAWATDGGKHSLHWMLSWVSCLIRFKFRLSIAAKDIDEGEQQLQNLSASVDLNGLYVYYDKLLVSIRLLDSQVNTQLLLEELLVSWRRLNTGNSN
jgi:DNA polymerase-3 subunit delta'